MLNKFLWRKKLTMHVCLSNDDKNNTKKLGNKLNLLIGPPNVGKSSFFNRITWQNSNVGNIDKVTTTTKLGGLRFDKKIKFLDMPGVYSLDPNTMEESIVIEFLMQKQFDKVVNVISASSLKRDLMLTIALLESGLLDNLVINMIDEVGENSINQFKMIRLLGVNVDTISVLKNKNIKLAINNIVNFSNKKEFNLKYPDEIELLISKISNILNLNVNVSNRFIAIQLLEGNLYIQKILQESNLLSSCLEIIHASSFKTLDKTKKIIRNTKNIFINHLYINCVNNETKDVQIKKIQNHRKIDKYLLNKWIGIPIFIVIMFAIYYLSFGPYAGGWITEQWTGALEKLQDIIKTSMNNANIQGFWVNFVGDGLFGGIFTVFGFLPYMIFVFGLIFIVEQTGFLSRISVILDKQLERFGLSGRSIITLLTGIGCNIVSILTARNSQSQKEKKIIILISPFLACTARLAVFTWIGSALVGINYAWLISIALTILSGVVSLAFGLFFSTTMFRKKNTFFLTELPPWRRPKLFLLFKSIGNEIWGFTKRVITIIAIVNLVMFLLLNISPRIGLIHEPIYSGSFNYQSASLLEYISLGFKYIFYPIGLGEDWRLSMSLLAAAPAKELAASNLELLFSSSENFKNSIGLLKAPIATSTSYLFFLIFYTPCLSTTVTLKKEGGWKLMGIHLLSAFLFAYTLSLVCYGVIGSFELMSKNSNFSTSAFNIINLLLLSISVISSIFLITYKTKFLTSSKAEYKSFKFINISIIISLSLFLLSTILMVINIYTFQ